MEDNIDIAGLAKSYDTLDHTWGGDNTFNGDVFACASIDANECSKKVATTKWVNEFYSGKTQSTPTINVPLLTPMWFDHFVSGRDWVCSPMERDIGNNYGWISGSTYSCIYSHLVGDYEKVKGTTPTTITIGGVQITFYLAEDGHRIIASGNNTNADDSLFSECGVSWFYVLDITNRRFKLPRTKFGFQGRKQSGQQWNAVGDFDEAGIPQMGLNYSYVPPSLANVVLHDDKVSIEGGINIVNNLEIESDGQHKHFLQSISSKVPATESLQHHASRSAERTRLTTDIETTSSGQHTHSFKGGITANHSLSGTISNKTIDADFNSGSLSISLTGGDSVNGKSATVQPPSTEMLLYFSTGEESDELLCGNGNGVINGEIFCSSDSTTIETTETDLYVVQNDCMLLMEVAKQNAKGTVQLYIKDGINNRKIAYAEYGGMTMDAQSISFMVPIIKGTKIWGSSGNTTATVIFTEYKMLSTTPQLAMPDYGSSEISEITTSPYTVEKNGWLFMRESDSQTSPEITINGVVANYPVSTSTAERGEICLPVSKNDLVTFTGMKGDKMRLIPCKTVEQSSPPVYITRIDSGFDAEPLNADKLYSAGAYVYVNTNQSISYKLSTMSGLGSDNIWADVDSSQVPTWWVKIYSNGWCEEGGKATIINSPVNSHGTINLKYPLKYPNYTVNGTSHQTYDQVSANNADSLSLTPSSHSAIAYSLTKSDGTSPSTTSFSWEAKGMLN